PRLFSRDAPAERMWLSPLSPLLGGEGRNSGQTMVGMGCVLPELPYHPARIPHGQHVSRDVVHDHAAGADRRVLPDGDPGTDDGPASDPAFLADFDGGSKLRPLDPLGCRERVMGRIELDAGTKLYIFPDVDAG